ncbi:DUF3325 domain-containing protein [Edaphosphingomonas haloaromaticamans]|uniref:DUF3325 domain-containing protein n=1 Tax=Edaphosphingomonas haloaromaticamans TaxID=653954 RepID=A0A1S1H9L1_9SPHN|nr:DUF3325 domain-containing protein [Sphingomonas haloaromaticamans]OHT18797.1 hypothetical protein BHE75_00774 [Sphingomonas haloaromaticamans]
MTMASALLLLAAYAALSLAMRRHAAQAVPDGRLVRHEAPLRIAGWTFLAASLALRLAAPGWRAGMVEWVGLNAAAAAIVVLALLYRPRWLPAMGLAALPLALLVLIV